MESQIALAQRALFLVGRGLLGLYFVVPGISKITGWSQMSDYMADHGVSSMPVYGVPLIPVLLAITIVVQVGGGAALLAGYRAQLMAFLLAGLTLVISLVMHDFWNLEEGAVKAHETQNFIKNMAIMAGLMYVAGSNPVHGKT